MNAKISDFLSLFHLLLFRNTINWPEYFLAEAPKLQEKSRQKKKINKKGKEKKSSFTLTLAPTFEGLLVGLVMHPERVELTTPEIP